MKIKYYIWVITIAVIFFIVAKPVTADIMTGEDKTIALGESLPHSVVIVNVHAGHGTGFYISPHEIITDEHVIHNATNVTTVDVNGKECAVNVFYADSNDDLALLDTKCEGMPLKLAKSVKVGQTVVMMGNPETETFFMTKGIVSVLKQYFVGFDATTIPGNSGSPVVNLNGEVVGVAKSVFLVSANIAMATNDEMLTNFLATVAHLKAT